MEDGAGLLPSGTLYDQRVALDGSPAEMIDAKAKDLAAKQLAQIAARKATKAAAPGVVKSKSASEPPNKKPETPEQLRSRVRAGVAGRLGARRLLAVFDNALHAEYLLIVTPVIGALAAVYELGDRELPRSIPVLSRIVAALATAHVARVAAGAILLLMLVHAVETAKFIATWTNYASAVRSLAMGTQFDPALGDRRFVSSDRIAADLNRVSWSSTTPFLSILVAPDFSPARLVVDPHSNYFWLSCETATENLVSDQPVPSDSRRLLRRYSCLHRKQ